MKDAKEMTPGEVDQILSDLWERDRTLLDALERESGRLKKYDPDDPRQMHTDVDGMKERIEKYQAERDGLKKESEPLEGEWRKRRWSRFFLCLNTNGHVHSSTHCSSFYPTTRVAWLPELSGKSEEEMVAEHGERACTICFPSAPTMEGWKEAVERRKKLEDKTCPGSRKPGKEGGSRQGYCAGNYLTCTVCGLIVGGAGYNVRKHQKPKEAK